MPLYSYKCKDCQETFDNFVPLETRNVLQECPVCKHKTGIRQIEVKMFDTGGTNLQKMARLDNNLKYTDSHKNHA